MLQFIWAQDEAGNIGLNGEMPWYLPNDLKHFKSVTLNHPVVMGRKTWEGLSIKPFPKRKNILLTSQKDYGVPEEVELMHSIEEVLAFAETSEIPVFIVGGANVYKQFTEEVDVLYQTIIHETFEADTQFPTIDFSKFELVEEKFVEANQEENTFDHTFKKYVRK